MTPEDINRRFWEIVDSSYTTAQYTRLIHRCRDLERDLAKSKVKA